MGCRIKSFLKEAPRLFALIAEDNPIARVQQARRVWHPGQIFAGVTGTNKLPSLFKEGWQPDAFCPADGVVSASDIPEDLIDQSEVTTPSRKKRVPPLLRQGGEKVETQRGAIVEPTDEGSQNHLSDRVGSITASGTANQMVSSISSLT